MAAGVRAEQVNVVGSMRLANIGNELSSVKTV